VLAQQLSVSPSMISQIETGRASPSVSTLIAIANELDLSLDELLFDDLRSTAGDATLKRATGSAGQEIVQRLEGRQRVRLPPG
jgi:transcriptional regulator with XRE-family HTH domain